MPKLGAYEAKTHLPRLLRQVESGEVVTITRNGRAVARLTRVPDASSAAARLLELRKTVSRAARGKKLSMRDLIAEGRR